MHNKYNILFNFLLYFVAKFGTFYCFFRYKYILGLFIIW